MTECHKNLLELHKGVGMEEKQVLLSSSSRLEGGKVRLQSSSRGKMQDTSPDSLQGKRVWLQGGLGPALTTALPSHACGLLCMLPLHVSLPWENLGSFVRF